MFKIPDFTTTADKYIQNLDFSSIITGALRTPGVKINRESF